MDNKFNDINIKNHTYYSFNIKKIDPCKIKIDEKLSTLRQHVFLP